MYLSQHKEIFLEFEHLFKVSGIFSGLDDGSQPRPDQKITCSLRTNDIQFIEIFMHRFAVTVSECKSAFRIQSFINDDQFFVHLNKETMSMEISYLKKKSPRATLPGLTEGCEEMLMLNYLRRTLLPN